MSLRSARLLVFSPLLFALACATPRVAAPPALPSAEAQATRTLAAGERFVERVSFDTSTAPDDVHLQGRFRSPSGKELTVRGFSQGEDFEVRFHPDEAGAWGYTIEAEGQPISEGGFRVTDGDFPERVTRDAKVPHAFALTDGRRFQPLGENRFNVYDSSWNWDQLSGPEYVKRMAGFGMNTLRIFIFTDCEREEPLPAGPQPGCIEPEFGRFDQQVAARYDAIFEAAEQHDIRIILTLYAVGFTPNETWKSWEDNPYNVAKGGPAKSPEDFFENPAAIEGAKKRLRYVMARWGGSPALFAIDLLNEPEWDGGIGEATWLPWARELARQMKAEDPYGHLVNAGPVGLHWNIEGDEHAWYGSPENDFVQWHLYGQEIYDSHDLAAEMTRKIQETWHHGKPTLVGEFGYGGEDQQTFDHTQVGIWTATFAGAGPLSHSAPVFTLDSDTPMTPERGKHFSVLSGFLQRFDPNKALQPATPPPAEPKGTRAWSMSNGQERALWVMGAKKGYGKPVENASVTLADLPRGSYRVTWINDVTGEIVQEEPLHHQTGRPVQLKAPKFIRHIAAHLSPLHQGESGPN